MDLGSRRLTLEILNGSPLVLQMREAGAGAAAAPQRSPPSAPAAAPLNSHGAQDYGGNTAAGPAATIAVV